MEPKDFISRGSSDSAIFITPRGERKAFGSLQMKDRAVSMSRLEGAGAGSTSNAIPLLSPRLKDINGAGSQSPPSPRGRLTPIHRLDLSGVSPSSGPTTSTQTPRSFRNRLSALRFGSKRNLITPRSKDVPQEVFDRESSFHVALDRQMLERRNSGDFFSFSVLEQKIWRQLREQLVPHFRMKAEQDKLVATCRIKEGSPRENLIKKGLFETEFILHGLSNQLIFLANFVDQWTWREEDKLWADKFGARLRSVVQQKEKGLLGFQFAIRAIFADETFSSEDRALLVKVFGGEEQFLKITRVADPTAGDMTKKLADAAFELVTLEQYVREEGAFSESITDESDPINGIPWGDIRNVLFRHPRPCFDSVDINGFKFQGEGLKEKEYFTALIYEILKAGFIELPEGAGEAFIRERAKRIYQKLYLASLLPEKERKTASKSVLVKEPVDYLLSAMTVGAFATLLSAYKALFPMTNEFLKRSGIQDSIRFDTREQRGEERVVRVHVDGPAQFCVSKEQLFKVCPLVNPETSPQVADPWATVKLIMSVSAHILGDGVEWKKEYRVIAIDFAPNLTKDECRLLAGRFQLDVESRQILRAELFQHRVAETESKPEYIQPTEVKGSKKKKKKKGKKD